MQFVEIGVPHEIVQTFMHGNVGITSSYMWGLGLCTIHPYKYFSPSIA